MATRIDPQTIATITGSTYPSPFHQPCSRRSRQPLGDVAGLSQFGVNLLTLPPGAWSAQRHWHTLEDEFVYVLSGEVTLVTDAGEQVLRAGDAAGFKAGDADGHCLQNRSDAAATVLEIGSRFPEDQAFYPDIDLKTAPEGAPSPYLHRDGTPYPDEGRR